MGLFRVTLRTLKRLRGGTGTGLYKWLAMILSRYRTPRLFYGTLLSRCQISAFETSREQVCFFGPHAMAINLTPLTPDFERHKGMSILKKHEFCRSGDPVLWIRGGFPEPCPRTSVPQSPGLMYARAARTERYVFWTVFLLLRGP